MSAMTDSAPNKPRLLYAPRWSLMCGVQIVQLLLDDIEHLPSNTNVSVVRVRSSAADSGGIPSTVRLGKSVYMSHSSGS
jgi:hypothetical protein